MVHLDTKKNQIDKKFPKTLTLKDNFHVFGPNGRIGQFIEFTPAGDISEEYGYIALNNKIGQGRIKTYWLLEAFGSKAQKGISLKN